MFSYEQVVDDLTRIGKEKDPNKMACYIYYVMKQYPDCPYMTKYEENIEKVAQMVAGAFDWSEKEVALVREYIREYTKYIKK